MSLILNIPAFSRSIALAMNLKKRFILKTKLQIPIAASGHIQLILTLVFKSLIFETIIGNKLRLIFPILFFLFPLTFWSQCTDYGSNPVQSPRIANYQIKLELDTETKKAHCNQTLTWKNTSPDTIKELRFYMYLNAFKNTESTLLKGMGPNIFGRDISQQDSVQWGYLEINNIKDASGNSLVNNWSYIQPDDGNSADQSVMALQLTKPILPGETSDIFIDFTAKMPRILLRSGYSKNDYYLFVHWFPQIGVYEKNIQGKWSWNCHQFFRRTEFYADFGNYEIEITVPNDLVLGATGCKISTTKTGKKTTYNYIAYDVIDFAWVVYPEFLRITDSWQNKEIELLIPPEHAMLADRLITAVKQGLEYLDQHVGPYPYPKITIVDPPVHALNSGFMEYPMLITGGSFYRAPDNIRTIESLIIHEFTHQYFMATLASNEKEEAWLDEGFVTYYEDRILDHYYGENCSLFDIFGYQSGNAENSRLEYTRLNNPDAGIIARPGWEIETAYKGLVYSKTATCLKTMEKIVGIKTMDRIIQSYYSKWKFAHPRGADFIKVVNDILTENQDSSLQTGMDYFFDQCIYDAVSCDFSVSSIINTKQVEPSGIFDDNDQIAYRPSTSSAIWSCATTISKKGEMVLPVEIKITFTDGTSIYEWWDGYGHQKIFTYLSESTIESVHVDPQQKIYLDLDLNNNSKTLKPNKKPLYKYSAKAIHWIQNILQFSSTFIVVP